MNFFCSVTIILCALACLTCARHTGERPHIDADSYNSSYKQTRSFPDVTVKELILLKFKKIMPISLILIRSSNENEAELVPIYSTSEIPSDVQFIPTPNGISNDRDVQAIVVPNEFHQELELNGLTYIKGIESLLNKADEDQNEEGSLTVAQSSNNSEDELLNIKEENEDQFLYGTTTEKPTRERGQRWTQLKNLV